MTVSSLRRRRNQYPKTIFLKNLAGRLTFPSSLKVCLLSSIGLEISTLSKSLLEVDIIRV